jgi:CHRD domain
MEALDNKTQQNQPNAAGLVPTLNPDADLAIPSKGSSVEAANLEKSLNQALAPDEAQTIATPPDDHDHKPAVGKFQTHIELDQVASARGLNVGAVARETSFRDNLGAKGDYLNPKGGNNVVIGSGDGDVIRGTGGGFNTITTGTGKDTVILGRETTNRVLDFDAANDRFVLSGLNPKNIIIAQGKNPGKGGLDQPLDSVNNALVIDKKTEHILASLPFVKASDLSEKNFARNSREANESLRGLKELGFKSQRGDGKLTGTQGHDRLIGGGGDDFLYVGDDGFKTVTAKGSGPNEFPFATDSPGTSELNTELKNGVLKVNGTYKNFDAFPLFSQGEKVIDPNAKILNGSDPVALINGFLKVPKDVEGNPISGTHFHFSPSGDSRGNFADATVVRYLTNTPTDAKSGTISGQFNLTPTEQAAFLAGDLYTNIHSNIDGDKDGRAGFPTGENRLNLNKDIVQFV